MANDVTATEGVVVMTGLRPAAGEGLRQHSWRGSRDLHNMVSEWKFISRKVLSHPSLEIHRVNYEGFPFCQYVNSS